MRTASLSPVLTDRLTPRTFRWNTLAYSLIVLSVTSRVVQAQPVISYAAITNAASYYSEGDLLGPEETLVGEIAQGSMFVISGRKIGPAEAQRAQDLPLPTELAGTSVRLSVGNTTRSAVVIYASARLVAGILPTDTPPGGGSFSVTYNGQTSAPSRVRVVRRAFGIFTQGGQGSGPALVQNVGPEGDHRLNTFTDAARPGQVMVLWGTGLGRGLSEPAVRPARTRPPADPNAGLEVLVGNKTARTLYAGRSGCCAGMDQIVFEAPAGVEGCFVPVAVRFGDGDMSRNFATFSIAAQGGTCSDPHNLSASEVERLQAGEVLSQGSIVLRGYFGRSLHVSAAFSRVNPPAYHWKGPLPPFGSCVVTRSALHPFPFPLVSGRTGGASQGRNANAGPVLNLRSPQGAAQVPQVPGMFYQQPWPGTAPWEGGEYAVDNGAGGADVGPFQTTILLPPDPFRWSNLPDPNQGHEISSTQDMTITWSGGDSTGEYVVIFGDPGNGSSFTCTERADKGSFSVPAGVLQSVYRGLALPRYFYVSVAARSLPRRFQARGLDRGELLYEVDYSTNFFLK